MSVCPPAATDISLVISTANHVPGLSLFLHMKSESLLVGLGLIPFYSFEPSGNVVGFACCSITLENQGMQAAMRGIKWLQYH